MVLTRKMKANGITEQDNIAANTLLQLHKDNSILKKLKDDMVNKDLKKERAKQEIIKQIEMWNSSKNKFLNIILECKKELEYIDVELAKIISELDNL
tara:strand:+ start:189 stop:479 length:291 start_codon:yes stop_codon:yes gene_type:complete